MHEKWLEVGLPPSLEYEVAGVSGGAVKRDPPGIVLSNADSEDEELELVEEALESRGARSSM